MGTYGRVPPPESASLHDQRRHARLIHEQTDKRLTDMESKQDYELSFTSAGIDRVIRLSNSLPFVPNRFQVVSGDGAFSVGKPNGKLADEDFIYLTTDAEYGTKFVARFWRT